MKIAKAARPGTEAPLTEPPPDFDLLEADVRVSPLLIVLLGGGRKWSTA